MPGDMRTAAGLLLACAIAAPAAAQQDPRWEIEAYGGLIAGQRASSGTRTLPAAGAPIVTAGTTIARRGGARAGGGGGVGVVVGGGGPAVAEPRRDGLRSGRPHRPARRGVV